MDDSSEEDVDESLTVPARPTEEDEVLSWSCDSSGGVVWGLIFPQDDTLIDFIDELGRSKPMRRSKVPKLLGVGHSQKIYSWISDRFLYRGRGLSSFTTMMGNSLLVPNPKYHRTFSLKIQRSMLRISFYVGSPS